MRSSKILNQIRKFAFFFLHLVVRSSETKQVGSHSLDILREMFGFCSDTLWNGTSKAGAASAMGREPPLLGTGSC